MNTEGERPSETIKALRNWDEIACGGTILEPGSASAYDTGSWRLLTPTLHEDRCVHCLFCWLYCPDGAIVVQDGKMVGFDYDHCKGCGLCEKVCPEKANAIEMVWERKEAV